MAIDDRDLAFNTERNYLKRTQTGTDSAYFGGTFQNKVLTITHNLGYIPAVRVFFEYNGVLFDSYGQSQVLPPAANSAYALYRVGANNMVITYGNQDGVAKTIKVYYIIYLDDAV